jgi:hypothetical protein
LAASSAPWSNASGLPVISVTVPPASVTTSAPPAWSQIFSR